MKSIYMTPIPLPRADAPEVSESGNSVISVPKKVNGKKRAGSGNIQVTGGHPSRAVAVAHNDDAAEISVDPAYATVSEANGASPIETRLGAEQAAKAGTGSSQEEKPADILPALHGAIGTILMQAGRLTQEAADRAWRHHRESGVPFGQAAVELGLLQVADVRFALAHQFSCPTLSAEDTSIAPEVVAAFTATHPTVEQMHHLREQLMLAGFGATPERRTVALVSAERGAGRSFVAANLAVVFAQLGQRTLLIDAHLQRPRQHELFRTENRVGLSTILAGRISDETVVSHPMLPALAVLGSGPLPPNPQDLLARPSFGQLLQRMTERFDALILDSPPWLEGSGARMVAAAAASALVVARTRRTPADGAARVARELSDARIGTYGVVLNRH